MKDLLFEIVYVSDPTVMCSFVPQDAYRVQDLEDTVSSLKRVLKERDKEVDELRAHQRALQAELHQVKSTDANFDKSQVYNAVLSIIAVCTHYNFDRGNVFST